MADLLQTTNPNASQSTNSLPAFAKLHTTQVNSTPRNSDKQGIEASALQTPDPIIIPQNRHEIGTSSYKHLAMLLTQP